jgi:3alpha(or 20beta)-hydroxysteroid dehydrogenase
VPEPFVDRTVMITGVAGALGGAMAHTFAAEVARVGVTGRKHEQSFNLPRRSARERNFVRLDVSVEAYWQSAPSGRRECGRLSVLINNAAYLAVGGFETVSVAEWRTVLDTNLTGAFFGIRAAATSMRKGAVEARRVGQPARGPRAPDTVWTTHGAEISTQRWS